MTSELYHYKNDVYTLTVYAQKVPLKTAFRISRGAKIAADVLVITLSSEQHTGWAEAVPYKRYGESYQQAVEQIHDVVVRSSCLSDLRNAINRIDSGAAKNALDCALWDLQAKLSNSTVLNLLPPLQPQLTQITSVITAQTLSINSPDEMAKAALNLMDAPLIKVKLDGDAVLQRMRAIHAASPHSQFIIDANEAWSFEQLKSYVKELVKLNVVLIEQPLAESQDWALSEFDSPIALCADESCHTAEGLECLVDRYRVINIKLDKAGGLSEALNMVKKARSLGLDIMVGCMVGSSLAMAPAMIVAQYATYVDLDGPVLVAQDRSYKFDIIAGYLTALDWSLWGGPHENPEIGLFDVRR
ncbi:dipeptide epimerase [Pseudoalteromonas sp. MMG005]|nr:dipeptide epimerase [Pseudoalteromonas sp. MMG005]